MRKRLPIKAAKDVAAAYQMRQVILCAWDGEREFIVTYGKSVEDCAQAAHGGNTLKEALGWPDSLKAEPARVRKLQEEIARLITENTELKTQQVSQKYLELPPAQSSGPSLVVQ